MKKFTLIPVLVILLSNINFGQCPSTIPALSSFKIPTTGEPSVNPSYFISPSFSISPTPSQTVSNCSSDIYINYATACTGTSYTYKFNFNESPSPYNEYPGGYLFNIVGGSIYSESFTIVNGGKTSSVTVKNGTASFNGSFPYTGEEENQTAEASPVGGYYTTSPSAYYQIISVSVTVQWTATSSSNSLQLYGFLPPPNSNTPPVPYYFTDIVINASPQPTVLPVTAIDLGEPDCNAKGWLLDGIEGSETFTNPLTWSYAGPDELGGVMGTYPNASNPSQWGPIIPNPYSSAVSITLSVYANGTGNSCVTSPKSATYTQTISIPSFSCGSSPYSIPGSLSKTGNETNQNSNQIYPNPVHNNLNISFDKAVYHRIEIVNPLGKVVQTSYSTSNYQNLDVSSLPKGVYFVKVFEGTNLVWTKKALIQ